MLIQEQVITIERFCTGKNYYVNCVKNINLTIISAMQFKADGRKDYEKMHEKNV